MNSQKKALIEGRKQLFAGVPLIHGFRESMLVVSAFIVSAIIAAILNKKYKRELGINEIGGLIIVGNAVGFFIGAGVKAGLGLVGQEAYSEKGIVISIVFALSVTLLLFYFSIVKGYLKNKREKERQN